MPDTLELVRDGKRFSFEAIHVSKKSRWKN